MMTGEESSSVGAVWRTRPVGEGHTALALAATNQNVAATRRLLDAGAGTEITNRHGNTALWAVVFNSRDDQTIVRLLLGAGAGRDHVKRRRAHSA